MGQNSLNAIGDRRLGVMLWLCWRTDALIDRAAVLAAFEAAEKNRLQSVHCYRTGMEAWRDASLVLFPGVSEPSPTPNMS
jgi:hypothetical protein